MPLEVLRLFGLFIGFVAWFLVVGMCVIAIHEGGHMFFGWLNGMRWVEIKIGLFGFKRGWRGTDSTVGSGWNYGYVLFDDNAILTRSRYTLVLLGGIIFNAVTGLAFSSVYQVVVSRNEWLGGFLASLAVGSALTAILNLVPFTYGSLESDGRQLWRLYAPGRMPQFISAQPKRKEQKKGCLRLDEIEPRPKDATTALPPRTGDEDWRL